MKRPILAVLLLASALVFAQVSTNQTVTGIAQSLATGVSAALSTAVGSVGSFLVNGGALGTPSSGAVTNLTGTASININGTVGSVTPAAGTFSSAAVNGTGSATGIISVYDGSAGYANIALQTQTSTKWFVCGGINGVNGNYFGVSRNGTCITPDLQITSAGLFKMAAYGAGAATFDASGNITSVSDERLKRDIRPFTRGIVALEGIKPILHGYTKESGLDQSRNDYAGFSAQNVKKYIPEAVGENKDGYLSFSDRPVIAALVNAVNDQQRKIKILQQEVRTLRAH